jgi:hypothetical protein
MTHVEGDRCVPDHVCVDGEQWIDGACRSVCASIANSRWDGERRSCVCTEGYRAEGGRCAAVSRQCPEGTRSEGNQCVAEIVCPEGYRYQAQRGCIDPVAEARAAQEREAQLADERARREQIAREEEERRVLRWGRGPGVQFSAGGGYQFMYMPNAYIAGTPSGTNSLEVTSTGAAAWSNGVVTAAATLIAGDLSLSALYTWGPGSVWQTPSPAGFGTPDARPCPDPSQPPATAVQRTDGAWCIASAAMHTAMLDVGQQGVGPRHTWRIGLGVGWEFAGGALASHISYRSTIKLVAGLFVALDVRAQFMLRLLENSATQPGSLIRREVLQTPVGFERDMATMSARLVAASPPVALGGAFTVSLGYSIH